MLKWTVKNQRSNPSFDNIDALSNASSGSDSTDSTNPGSTSQHSYLKNHNSSRSAAFFYTKSNNNNTTESGEHKPLHPSHKMKSSSLENDNDEETHKKVKSLQRHASTCFDYSTDMKANRCHSSTENGVMKISTNDNGPLKISTKNPKDKQRNGFWRSLKAKAQGKGKDGKLSRSGSIRSTNENDDYELATADNAPALPITELIDSTERLTEKTTALGRPRSFKLIRRQSQNKKPRPFNKQLSMSVDDDNSCEAGAISPDSGVSSIRQPSTDSEAEECPGSPNSVISHDFSNDISQLRKQFTDAVLHYLNERTDSKTNSINDSISSKTSEMSESGASDIFCYDSDTVLRRPNQTTAVVRS